MARLESRFKDKSARVGVVGLGFVGLPLAAAFARAGFRVLGFESSPERAKKLARGASYVPDVSSQELRRLIRAGRFEAPARSEELTLCGAILVCVQTPLRKTGVPDLGPIRQAARAIALRLRRGQLVVLESTTFPGATEEVLRPILEKTGLKAGRDFFLAFSPERIDPGNKSHTIANTPKIVGGIDAASGRLAASLYGAVVPRVVRVSSARAAETAKLLENSFRAVNIALVNEMALICRRLGLDVWEVIAAAATKPFGFMPFYPGPGIGGHCIPKDPRLLSWKMRALDFKPRFLELAGKINFAMPRHAAGRIVELLAEGGKKIKGARVLAVGVAYKADTPDFRESPALDVLHILSRSGARISYHDPYIPRVAVGGRVLRSASLTQSALKRADCVAVLTAHRGVDYPRIARLSRRVFDARNALRGVDSANVRRL